MSKRTRPVLRLITSAGPSSSASTQRVASCPRPLREKLETLAQLDPQALPDVEDLVDRFIFDAELVAGAVAPRVRRPMPPRALTPAVLDRLRTLTRRSPRHMAAIDGLVSRLLRGLPSDHSA